MSDERSTRGGGPLPRGLLAGDLARRCDPSSFDFETTAELEDALGFVGQERAERAVRFGVGIRSPGFNIFALGAEETDKRTAVLQFLEERAGAEPAPPDLCYVNNFEEAHKPRTLILPAGTGCELSKELDRTLVELRSALETAFESEEYQTRRQGVQEEAGEEQQEAFEELDRRAREKGLRLIRTPMGFVFAPVEDGEIVPPDELDRLAEEERERLQEEIEALQEELQKILRRMPKQQRAARERVRELDREIARAAVRELLGPLRERYAEHDAVVEHLGAVEADVIENVHRLLRGDGSGNGARDGSPEGGSDGQLAAALAGGAASPALEGPALRRYRVHVVVDHSDSEHAPVIYEDLPTYQNLVGRVEYVPVMGALITDFNLIKAGALHEAAGGYLVLDAQRLLTQPFAWEGLKRTLQSGEVRIESPREVLGLVSTVSLDPEPMPAAVKVVLVGRPLLYYLLDLHDPDFGDLFKVEAEFDDRMERTPGTETVFARLVAGIAASEELRPFDRGAVARVIDRSGRMAGDSKKLSVLTRRVRDLLCEADHWAAEEGSEVVSAEHVGRAVDEWIFRSSRLRDRMQEQIERGTVFIDTEGSVTGQVNGLSVIQLGDFAFGRPARITARVRLGKGEVVDIEREVELSGPIHSKGVLILTGFLGARYATERPLALAASLVFEQSYSGIEGDSASSAELYALLSAIGEIPIRQGIAVTGSINQHGGVQPIGGVNEKIEGFFDVCAARGLTGDQGVLIPASNVEHLMLHERVVEAVEAGRFHVWPVETVDQGIEVLTGVPAGERDDEGAYPEGSVNARVEARLGELAERAKELRAEVQRLGGVGGPPGAGDEG